MEALIESPLLQDYLQTLEAAQQDSFKRTAQTLQQLATTAVDINTFLADFADQTAKLFAASAVGIWFLDDNRLIARRVDVGWEHMDLDGSNEEVHQQLVSYALSKNSPLAIQPFSKIKAGSAIANPTDSFLLLGPAQHNQTSVAVVEIVLGPKPLRRPHSQLVVAYKQWMAWLTKLLTIGLERCFQSAQPMLAALTHLRQTATKAELLQAEIVRGVQNSLQSLAGRTFGSLSANQTIAKEVHSLLDGKGLRVKCTECGTPAILRCQKSAFGGVWVFDHYLEKGRTFHGGSSVFPLLELVAKPPRRKAN